MKPDFNKLASKALIELGMIPSDPHIKYMAELLRKMYLQGIDDTLKTFDK